MSKLVRLIILDILRNRFIVTLSLVLLGASFIVFLLEDNSSKGLLSLLNIALLLMPLLSVLYTCSYVYNRTEFIELLVSQPVKRSQIWLSLFTGIALSILTVILLGLGIPLIIFSPDFTGLFLLLASGACAMVFVSLGLWITLMTKDKARGIGFSLITWLFYALLFDGLLMFFLFQFSDYPIEKPMIAISLLNPIGLSRILVLLQLDLSAMMGYTGALFKEFFGQITGISISTIVLLVWVILPLMISTRIFNRKDM